jgi:hypothetical protein
MTDDQGTGKPCPTCEWPTVAIRSHNERLCVVCKHEIVWHLSEGQKPLLNNNRGDRKQ